LLHELVGRRAIHARRPVFSLGVSTEGGCLLERQVSDRALSGRAAGALRFLRTRPVDSAL